MAGRFAGEFCQRGARERAAAVMLDVVYNHSLDSSLMQIAPEVYGTGPDQYGDGMNCGHPMTTEFLRQATVYLWRTFGLDGSVSMTRP